MLCGLQYWPALLKNWNAQILFQTNEGAHYDIASVFYQQETSIYENQHMAAKQLRNWISTSRRLPTWISLSKDWRHSQGPTEELWCQHQPPMYMPSQTNSCKFQQNASSLHGLLQTERSRDQGSTMSVQSVTFTAGKRITNSSTIRADNDAILMTCSHRRQLSTFIWRAAFPYDY